MGTKNKFFFNATDWVIICLYLLIALVVSFLDLENGDWGTFIFEFGTYVIFTLLPIYIIMRFILPRTFELGKFVLFFVYSFIVLAILGYLELWSYKIYESKSWNMFSLDIFYYGIISQAENIGLLLALLIGKRFYETKLQFSDLQKEQKTNELRMLNSQIDPHFLFNNLNTVDNLIDTDPRSAKKYLNQLSKLYRYLISTKDEELVLLEDELKFVENYIFLIEKRFGNAFIFNVNIPDNLLTSTFVPPGALQGLLENAVKHNMGTPHEPIVITISAENEYLIVKNNLKKRKKILDSTGIGLENIDARYKLIYGKPIEIQETDHFKVSLPIIHKSDQ